MVQKNWRKILNNYRLPLGLFLGGLTLTIIGLIALVIPEVSLSSSKVEVLKADAVDKTLIVFEIAGAVNHPGVYRLPGDTRIIEAIQAAKGFSVSADMDWVNKNINKAAPIVDGQKIYIPSLSLDADSQLQGASANNTMPHQTVSTASNSFTSDKININTATPNELDTLPGIGPVYAQSIIEQRPYSSVDELLIKGAVKNAVYLKIKDLISVY